MTETNFYWKGDAARYTGREIPDKDSTLYEFVLLEGAHEGETKVTYRPPCGYCGKQCPDSYKVVERGWIPSGAWNRGHRTTIFPACSDQCAVDMNEEAAIGAAMRSER